MLVTLRGYSCFTTDVTQIDSQRSQIKIKPLNKANKKKLFADFSNGKMLIMYGAFYLCVSPVMRISDPGHLSHKLPAAKQETKAFINVIRVLCTQCV